MNILAIGTHPDDGGLTDHNLTGYTPDFKLLP
jgi:hypothetical protein